MDKESLKSIEAPIADALPEIRNIILKVLQAEKDKLYQDKPRILDDIVAIVKSEVK